MIDEVVISNFQSLRKLKLRLGKFTVVTGPTGTGKSAIIRAVRLLAFNARGTQYISRGAKSAMVGMDCDDFRVVVQRGNKDFYEIYTPDAPEGQMFTKLAGKVPDVVAQTLRLSDINFAGQFDRPYLLDATGGEVSRVLGKLTNVTLLYRAAQEANRRRLASAGELKTRQADLAALEQQKLQFASLGAERAAVERAEQMFGHLQEIDRRRERVRALAAAVARAYAALNMLRDTVPVEPPSLERLEQLATARARVRALFEFHGAWERRLSELKLTEQASRSLEEGAQRELHDYTMQWGVCPSCGQPVRKSHSHREEDQ